MYIHIIHTKNEIRNQKKKNTTEVPNTYMVIVRPYFLYSRGKFAILMLLYIFQHARSFKLESELSALNQ